MCVCVGGDLGKCRHELTHLELPGVRGLELCEVLAQQYVVRGAVCVK